MKKTIFILSLLLFMASISQAQIIRLGMKGGFAVNSYAVENLEAAGARLGLQFGLLSEIELQGRGFYLQPEVLFSTKGGKYRVNTTEVRENHSYIDVPLLFKYKILDLVDIYGGPQISFLSSGNYKYNQDGAEIKIDNRDYFNQLDYGLAAGVGVNISNVLVDLRYNLGLRNTINQRPVVDTIVDGKVKNRGFQLSASYFFW